MGDDNTYKNRGLIIIILGLSAFSASFSVIFIKLYHSEINAFFSLVGDNYVLIMLISSILILLGANYYLKNRLTTNKEDFKIMGKAFVSLMPILIISTPGIVEIIINNEVTFYIFLYFITCIVAFYYLYWQLLKISKGLLRKFLESVTDKKDRLSVAITIVGVLISLIALFR